MVVFPKKFVIYLCLNFKSVLNNKMFSTRERSFNKMMTKVKMYPICPGTGIARAPVERRWVHVLSP